VLLPDLLKAGVNMSGAVQVSVGALHSLVAVQCLVAVHCLGRGRSSAARCLLTRARHSPDGRRWVGIACKPV